uniref:Uncharacterized protein n=1 Tax=Acrobeloides nanus TaxID=290746 RepID=A0A914E8M2_9BILA
MGNCFTFNHQNATKVYNLRYSGGHGGFRAQMNVNQAEYLNWVYTASMLVFLHRREETIMGESVSYQVAPGEESTFVIQRDVYTRLGKPYGICIESKTEVKSYYNPGSAYTIDDYVQQICGCMDPKYYMAYNATACGLSKKDCVDNITLARGQPSTWSECYCPPPCYEYIVDVAWTKTVFRTVLFLPPSIS